MSGDDPRHGSTRGYSAGCRCDPCRKARNEDERNRRKRREVLGVRRLVDGTGTVRRIRALWAMGWRSADIAARCGWGSPQAISELAQPTTARRGVFLGTAETVARVYDELCMTPGPSDMTRRRAVRNGYAPPLAWDDIDRDPEPHAPTRDDDLDEVVVQRVLAGEWRLPTTPAEKAEVARRWVAGGRSTHALKQVVGWKVERYYRKADVA